MYVCEREGCVSIGTKKKVHKPCCEEYLNKQQEDSWEDLSEWQDHMYGQLDRNVCFTCHSKILSINQASNRLTRRGSPTANSRKTRLHRFHRIRNLLLTHNLIQ